MKLKFDEIGEKEYYTGVSDVILFPMTSGVYGAGVAWNGVTKISESPEGAEPTDLYANNSKYLTLLSAENLKATLEAYMFPKAFEPCDGQAKIAKGIKVGQQTRQAFGLAYKTLIGNDTDGTDYGYQWHLMYGCKASPSNVDHSTVNDSPEANTFSWSINTTPVDVPIEGCKKTASVTIDSNDLTKEELKKFEDMLLGTDDSSEGANDGTNSTLPLPADLIKLYSVAAG